MLSSQFRARQVAAAAAICASVALVGCKDEKETACGDFDQTTCDENGNHGCSWFKSENPECIAAPDQETYLTSNPEVCTALGGKVEAQCVSTCSLHVLTEMVFGDITDTAQDVIIGWPAINEGSDDKSWGQNGLLYETGATRCFASIMLDPTDEGKALIQFAVDSECATDDFKTGDQTINQDQFAMLQPLKKDANADACANASCQMFSDDAATAPTCQEPHAVCSELGVGTESENACNASSNGDLGASNPCSVLESGICSSTYDACNTRGVQGGELGESCAASDDTYGFCQVGSDTSSQVCAFDNGFACAVLSSDDQTCGYTTTTNSTATAIENDWIDVCQFVAAAPDGACVGTYVEDLTDSEN